MHCRGADSDGAVPGPGAVKMPMTGSLESSSPFADAVCWAARTNVPARMELHISQIIR